MNQAKGDSLALEFFAKALVEGNPIVGKELLQDYDLGRVGHHVSYRLDECGLCNSTPPFS
jgi:hypothetical protein